MAADTSAGLPDEAAIAASGLAQGEIRQRLAFIEPYASSTRAFHRQERVCPSRPLGECNRPRTTPNPRGRRVSAPNLVSDAEERRVKRRLRDIRPVGPAAVERPYAARGPRRLVRKPCLGSKRLLHPLFEVAGIISTNILPDFLLLHRGDPRSFAGPPTGRNKYKGGIVAVRLLLGGLNAFREIAVGLISNVCSDAELPAGVASRNPRRAGASFNEAIPTRTLRVIIAGEIYLLQILPPA
jgi:hypothetical protein